MGGMQIMRASRSTQSVACAQALPVSMSTNNTGQPSLSRRTWSRLPPWDHAHTAAAQA